MTFEQSRSRAAREGGGRSREPEDPEVAEQEPPNKRVKSPENSEGGHQRNQEQSAPEPTTIPSIEFPLRPAPRPAARLWQEGDPPLTRSDAPPQAQTHQHNQHTQQHARHSRRNQSNRSGGARSVEQEDPSVSVMIKEPATSPISQEQLVREVKGIYAGLVLVETKCIEVDSAQNAQAPDAPKPTNEQWQALIALHRTLVHEHHDFLLATQHPSATQALRRLAGKYSMPTRLWRHAIHTFLEVLRRRLPDSLEHMHTFIIVAYSIMALLYETVPAFRVSCNLSSGYEEA